MVLRREVVLGGGALAAIALAKVGTQSSPAPKTSNPASSPADSGPGLSAAATNSSAIVLTPAVDTQYGKVQGQVLDSTTSPATTIQVNQFLGIPFAAPPVGALRFVAPQPISQHFDSNGPLHCTKMPNRPVSITSFTDTNGTVQYTYNSDLESEDCLYINIWAPAGKTNCPVVVWIYGGGNIGGAISDYDGRHFAEQGIVFVAINYRVGLFGFLIDSSNAYDGTGNNGLKDQVFGLRWVQNNIANFGGNPNSVTLAGQSAGANDCIALLTRNNASKDFLFSRVIVASGGGAHLGDKAKSVSADYMNNIRSLNIDERGASTTTLQLVQQAKFGTPNVYVDGTFIDQEPLHKLYTKNYPLLPMIIGHNLDEYLAQETLDQSAGSLAGKMPGGHFAVADLSTLDSQYTSLYANTPFNRGHGTTAVTTGQRHIRLKSADWIKIGVVQIAERHSLNGGWTYYYSNEYRVPAPGTLKDKNGNILYDYTGYCPHGADLPFDFDLLLATDNSRASGKFGYTPSNSSTVANNIFGCWVKFISNQARSMSMDGVSWGLYDTTNRGGMVINQHSSTDPGCQFINDPVGPERAIWNTLGVPGVGNGADPGAPLPA